MGEIKDYMKDQFEAGLKIGEDETIPPKEALKRVGGIIRGNYATAANYTECRKIRKKAIAERLHQLRKEHELKQQEVAEKTGLNVVTLSGYEIGKNEPNSEALVRLADAYGVSLDYLMCRTNEEEKEHQPE